jgi:hypothetical protein
MKKAIGNVMMQLYMRVHRQIKMQTKGKEKDYETEVQARYLSLKVVGV